MIVHYLLRDGVPVPTDTATWANSPEAHYRVAETQLEGVWISTVFFGTDMNYAAGGPPLVFETMVFCDEGVMPEWQNECDRYSTLEEAKAGHDAMVKRVLQAALDHATHAETNDDATQSTE